MAAGTQTALRTRTSLPSETPSPGRLAATASRWAATSFATRPSTDSPSTAATCADSSPTRAPARTHSPASFRDNRRTPPRYVNLPRPPMNVYNWESGYFVQDDFRVNSRLTLNLGMRYDLMTPFIDKNDLMANLDPNYHDSVHRPDRPLRHPLDQDAEVPRSKHRQLRLRPCKPVRPWRWQGSAAHLQKRLWTSRRPGLPAQRQDRPPRRLRPLLSHLGRSGHPRPDCNQHLQSGPHQDVAVCRQPPLSALAYGWRNNRDQPS